MDHFIQASGLAQGLEVSPPADRNILVRRLFLGLTGLPPRPSDLDHWAGLDRPDWVGELIEELLRSPRFGERWAQWWLDAARYADSDGYEKDKPREVWFYRDWVIQALNEDLPYDQFIIRQVAGDLPPGASQADRIATGFLRNSMVNEEGGADPEQFRVEGMFDRLDALGKSVLGITTQCAQCHAHKYDPLTQEEYYGMYAALNNFHEGIISVYTPAEQVQRAEVLGQITEIETQLRQSDPAWRQRLQQWHARCLASDPSGRRSFPPNSLGRTEIPTTRGWLDHQRELYATRNDISFPCRLEPGTYTAVRLDLLTHPQLPHGGPGRSIYGTGALTRFEFSVAGEGTDGQRTAIAIARAVADVNPPVTRLPAAFRDRQADKDGRVTGGVEMAIDDDGQTAWSTDNGPGRRNQDRHAIFALAAPLVVAEPTTVWFRLVQNHGGWNSDDNQNYLLGRYRFSITQHPEPTDRAVPSALEPLMHGEFDALSAAQVDKLYSHWIATQPEWAESTQRIEALWQSHPAGASQLVAIERDQPRDTYLMLRGDFLKPGPRVEPAVPGFLNPAVESEEPARLRLARWLVDRRAPTTARVVVNRIWQAYFGQGLVTSAEDFGRQSPPPSHPELLDWLAVELMDHQWSLKHIHRRIVQSATYQQSSVVHPEQLQVDRYNRWLMRGPRFRLDAEGVRDVALSTSGMLNPTIGGPSIYPPAPEFLFRPPASYGPKTWAFADTDQQYRRSLYVHRFRSVPYPPLQVFDAPKGDGACVRRERSNTPLQALVLLNEPQFVELARALATRILRESPGQDDRARIVYGHTLVTARVPDEQEIAILENLAQKQRQRLAYGQLPAEALVGAGEQRSRQLSGYSASELLPWIVVARALLNLDETITKG